ncbi:Nicotinate-nucleotide pyrophosphorylase (Carboxylating) [Sinomonas atrocyanea]|uniref:nicotinate-nucleotide diphosphorylase (carboxylating) n=1 Tax=Sinomonas atrocyanea TaxID=37927 RepID=A0A127A3E3_9MICC|nr:Nicotinate-nucleotide pyrophosphorylase (Carboxylating) [Sinomonas atrocyanea]
MTHTAEAAGVPAAHGQTTIQWAPIPLPTVAVRRVLEAAYAEDAPSGDLTSLLLIPAEAAATAELRARVPGVFSGGPIIEAGFRFHDPDAAVELLAAEGEEFAAGAVLARVTGRAQSILTAERVVLNLVQRMSAIAALTAQYVALTAGTGARIVDTRKTTPGLRELERYAVRCGGGRNHRFSLSDAVMAKDNHLAVLTGGDPARLTEALRGVRARLGHTTHVEVEVDRLEQIEPVLAAGWTRSCSTTSPSTTCAPASSSSVAGPSSRRAEASPSRRSPPSPPRGSTSSRSGPSPTRWSTSTSGSTW